MGQLERRMQQIIAIQSSLARGFKKHKVIAKDLIRMNRAADDLIRRVLATWPTATPEQTQDGGLDS
jgi:hypothetical protein